MQVKRGKFYKYLGMILEYSTVGIVKITILEYIDEILNAFDKENPTSGNTKSSAAPDVIFMVEEYCKKPNAKQAM